MSFEYSKTQGLIISNGRVRVSYWNVTIIANVKTFSLLCARVVENEGRENMSSGMSVRFSSVVLDDSNENGTSLRANVLFVLNVKYPR